MKIELTPEAKIIDIRKLTGLPAPVVKAALRRMQCSYERFRHFCLNQGAMPSPEQQLVLRHQEEMGKIYDFPNEEITKQIITFYHGK